jgi:glutathione S-transferase
LETIFFKVNLLAKKCDLLPDDDIEAAYADMFALQFTDVFNAFGQILFDTPNNQSARFNEFFNGIWSLTMNRTEERIRSNAKHNCKVIAGKDLSYADIYLSSILELASAKGTNRTREQFLDAYPYIKQVDIKVRSRPGIARWLMTRPITEN